MKEAFYFSHDCNARHDPKITAMRGVYGSEGYGWYWMIIEMMRESDNYKLNMQSKYAFNAFALQLQTDSNTIAEFVHDCIEEFNLFESDGEWFWSESLLRRMKIREDKSEKARQSAMKRWEKQQDNANDMRTHSEGIANESKNDALKESKVKEIKNYTPEFEEFWFIYPRRKEKAKAFKCWNARLKDVSPDLLILCAKNYADEVKRKGTTEDYMKHPATFLGANKPYEDYKESKTSSKVINGFDFDVQLQRWIESGGDPSEFVYRTK